MCNDGSYNFFLLMQNFIWENDGRIHAIQLDVASLNVEYIHLLVSVGITALYRISLTMPVYYMCDGVVDVQVCQYRCVGAVVVQVCRCCRYLGVLSITRKPVLSAQVLQCTGVYVCPCCQCTCVLVYRCVGAISVQVYMSVHVANVQVCRCCQCTGVLV